MAPPVETEAIPVVTDKGPDPQNVEPSKSGKALVGIIYPPPEIRNIVDKTAGFVARNGPEFETRIRSTEANNAKFNFLNATDPYHAYYQHKVKEIVEGKVVESSIPKPVVSTAPQKIQEAIKAAEFVPKEAPGEFEFAADPATINAFDLDLIKLTAMFVARNGRQFLTQLMQREARNYQFDFLKPQHSNFGYFTKLVEQYTKILIPPKDIAERLRKELDDTKSVLENVKYRVEWERYQRRLREREEAEAEKERMAYAQIDWHDFVVVQTVDFQPHETSNLPPPCNPKDVGARLLAQQRIEATKSAAQTIEMEVESGSEGEDEEDEQNEANGTDAEGTDKQQQKSTPQMQNPKPKFPSEVSQPIPAPPNPENVLIRKDYNPKDRVDKVKHVEQKWVISPLTGEKIPADKLAEHMKFNTVDQQYFVQKEREIHDKQDEEPVYAPGTDISANIRQFASRRSDIFGVGSKGAEQTMIGKVLGEEDRPRVDPKAIWDGHQATVEATTRAAQSHVSIEEQIAQIHRTQGLLPDQEKERIGPKTGGAGGQQQHNFPDVSQQPHPPPQQQPPPSRPPPTAAAALMAAANQAAAAAFNVRSAMSAAVVPVVQMTPASVVIVQQPPLGMVGGLYAQPPQGPPQQFRSYGPPPVPPPQGGYGNPQPPPQRYAPPPPQPQQSADDGPAAKKAKNIEDSLLPENDWLSMHAAKGPVTVAIQCPNAGDKPEWKLSGQTLNVPFDLKETINDVKTRIQDLTNLPSSKQKLVYEGLFVKDSQSLAYYNLLNGSVIQLQLKERGGRKK